MKRVLLIIVIISAASFNYAQFDKMKRDALMKKIHKLEQVKLIETLDLDEETSIKFFTRRKEMKKKQHKLHHEMEKILHEADSLLELESADDEQYNKLIEEFISLRNKAHTMEISFIKSLDDILTPREITEYVLFEKHFREEMKKLLLKGMKRKHHRR